MKPVTELPGDYESWDTVELSNKRLVLLLTVLATVALAVGDLCIVAWLLTKPGHILIRDFGTGMAIYGLQQK